jgi:hypothetical protein
MYDATLGRFLQRDPMGFGSSPGLYEYANDNPTDFADATGLIVISSRSGINDPNSSIQNDVIRYVAGLANPNVTYGNHVGSTHTSGWNGTLGLNTSQRQLNEEAQALAGRLPQGDFCKPRRCPRTQVGVVMVAPKLQLNRIQNFLASPNNCCDIQFLTFYSSEDSVPNQQIGIRDPDWSALGRARDIRLGGFLNHGWDPNAGGVPGSSGSPLHPANDLRASLLAVQILRQALGIAANAANSLQNTPIVGGLFRYLNGLATNALAGLGNGTTSFRQEINAMLGANKDYGYVCHSQGCNITIFELIRRCSRFGG